MAKCDYCRGSIWFGGEREGNLRFCSRDCRQNGLLALSAQVPEDQMRRIVDDVHRGTCPKCNGPGPVDLQTHYTVWSALVMTSFATRTQIACHGCGQKSRALSSVGALFLGWWGLPWGLIMTPVQIIRNIHGLMSARPSDRPSASLESALRKAVAADLLRQDAEAALAAPAPAANRPIVS